MAVPYTLEDVDHLYDLILPRLEAVRNSGDSSKIHRANQLIATILGYRNWAHRAQNVEAVYVLVTYREYIKTAEMWLAEIAGR